MNSVLYRKYRPAGFDEVAGQEHVVKTLRNSIKNGRIAHAYLFSGPRGTGKTTLARILAKAINCENSKEGAPCNSCKTCLEINQNKFFDLVEIDAATYTKVESIRDVIEKINFAPASGKYKVYIIDEVHMLSRSASNALLKTLEEPPRHAIFILATTEAHKIPATIISRCQKFDFRRLKISEIKEKLKKIAQKENVKVEDAVFDFIAINSNGGMRDSESLLGQILSIEGDNITLKEVQDILAVTDISKAVEFVELMIEKKYSNAISYINKINDEGYDSEQFAKSIVEYARKLILIKVSPPIREKLSSEMTEDQIEKLEEISRKASMMNLVRIIRAFIQAKEEIKSSILPQLPIEVAIAEINVADENPPANLEGTGKNAQKTGSKPAEKTAVEKGNSEKDIENPGFSLENESNAQKEATSEKKEGNDKSLGESVENDEKVFSGAAEVSGEDKIDLETVKSEWSDILEEVKPYNHSLTAFLKTCQPVSVEGANTIIVSCKYSFHKDKLQKISNKSIIEKAAQEILKKSVLMKFISHEDAKSMGFKLEEIKMKKENEELVNSALEMFGGEVV